MKKSFGGLFAAILISAAGANAAVITPPYVNTFDDSSSIDGFTIVDSNSDGYQWYFEPGFGANRGWIRLESNASKTGDDWFISPAIALKGATDYQFSITAWAKGFPERFEVYYGKSATAAAMTTKVIGPTEVGKNLTELEPGTFSGTITPSADGNYYIGIHGISDADEFYLNIDNFSISGSLAGDTPAAPADMKVSTASEGSRSVEISFTSPDKDIAGNSISSLDKVEIYRSGVSEPIYTLTSVAPGQKITYTDTPEKPGLYTYTVVAYNAAGKGELASREIFAGVNFPDEMHFVEIVEDATPGQVTLSWLAVTDDITGKLLPEGAVTYNIYAYDKDGKPNISIASGIDRTSYTFTAYSGNSQEFVRYYVCAATEMGYGDGKATETIPVGNPYDDFHATFADGKSKYNWITGASSDYVQIGFLTDECGFSAQDGDNGFAAIIGEAREMSGAFYSGKISLKGLKNPAMVFYTYNLGTTYQHDDNLIVVEIKTPNGEFVKVFEKPVWELAYDISGWAKTVVDISEYAGDIIEFTLGATVKTHAMTFFDNISFSEMPQYDLAVLEIQAPEYVASGQNYDVVVNVANYGSQTVSDWKVNLYADGKNIATGNGCVLDPLGSGQAAFSVKMSPLAENPIALTAELVFDDDQNMDDNLLDKPVMVNPVVSMLPYVKDLSAKVFDHYARLEWSEPDLDAEPEPITEDFETGGSFAAQFGDWIFVDGDGSEVGGFQGVSIPGIVSGESKGSFWVWDGKVIDGVAAHSGEKFLFSLYRADDGQSDEWAISPALDSKQQTISFYAASWSDEYPDMVEVWYSKGSTDPKDFIKIEGVGGVVPEGGNSVDDWTLYTAQLPQGAKRFAIRSCAQGGFMLLVDDVTFTPQRANENLSLAGYNVYRDGEKLNKTPIGETTFDDTTGYDGQHYTYQVTTLFSKGESRGSNPVEVTFISTGIDSLLDQSSESIRIYDLNGYEVSAPIPGKIYIRKGKKTFCR